MMPLWMTATRPSAERCGWALRSVGPPWVAHLVCPIPVVPVASPWSVPAAARSATAFSRLDSLPADLQATMSMPSMTATPAES